MTADRWQRVKSLFERALDLPASARDELLKESGESASIVDEVRNLLTRDAHAGSFLINVGSAPSSAFPVLSPNDVVSGHFRILSLLGRGGMGVVYRAVDLILSRPVALKFLAGDLGGTTLALERLKREARAAAALNHPNICVIYETGDHQGQPFIALELLDGKPLKQWIGTKPLRMEDVLDWAVQIASGLAAAHQTGIIHRDIKPANIFVTKLGQVKILDFGLAKVATPPVKSGPPDLTSSLSEEYETTPGMVIGTVPYMSPEQARGEQLDSRTDLFSFGAVLYEMATGKSAFTGASSALIHQAILSLTPPPASAVNAKIPLELDRIIDKALEKDRDLRYQNATDIGADLKRLQRDSDSGRQTYPSQPARALTAQKALPVYRHRLLMGSLIGLVLIALALGWAWLRSERFAARPIVVERQLTRSTSDNRALGGAISPDGKYLAFADTNGLHLVVIDTGEIHAIPLPEELQTKLWEVSWYPDGEKLLLTVQSKTEGLGIWVKSIFGGVPRKLRTSGRSAVVSPQGRQIAFTSSGSHEIWVMGPNGENPKKIFSSENEVLGPLAWSPTGERIAYLRYKSRDNAFGGAIETLAFDGGAPSIALSDPRLSIDTFATLLWFPDGRLIFALEGRAGSEETNLWEIRTASRTGKSAGKAAKITSWYGIQCAVSSRSQDGKRIVVTKMRNRAEVYVGGLNGQGTRMDVPRRLTLSDSQDHPFNWTPDSQTILFESDRTGRFQLYRQRLDQETPEQLIPAADEEINPASTPEGAWILYWTTSGTRRKLMRAPTAGGPPEQVLESIEPTEAFDCPTHSSDFCVVTRSEHGNLIFDKLDPVRGPGKELARIAAPADAPFGISPNGSRIAVVVGNRLSGQVHILDLRNHAEQTIPLPSGWQIPSVVWAADGNGLFAGVQSTNYLLARIELDGKTHVLLDRGRNQYLGNPLPSPDGRQLAFAQQTFEANFWLLENL
jgi:serine/threonine protein kinase/Tol biopolymer transport system component